VRRAVPGIRVLHGLEVDILGDGSLDLDDEGLAMLDWVIVSLHSRLTQPRAEMTARVLKALSHPKVHVMGHPTARMLGKREPVDIDIEAVLDQAAARGVLMEINAQPHRIDLCDLHARMAKERGIKLVIDTDGHTLVEMENMRYGIFAARRAGLEKADVLNTLEFDELAEAIRHKTPAIRAKKPEQKPEKKAAKKPPMKPERKAAKKPPRKPANKPAKTRAR